MEEPRELTADDLAQDIIRFIESPWGGRFEGLLTTDGVYATDKYTLVLELEDYSPMIMYYLGHEDRAVYSPPETEVAGPGSWENQVGTGPFMFEDYVIGSHMNFVRNPNYWNMTTIDGVEYQMPFIDRLVLTIIPDQATRVAALITGAIDLSRQVLSAQWSMVENTVPDLEKISYLGSSTSMNLPLRADEPPFDDVDVRRAMMIGTDIKAFQKFAMATQSPMNWLPIDPAVTAYTPLEDLPADIQVLFEYDPDLAMDMLEDALGPPDANGVFLKTTVLCNASGVGIKEQASLLANQWEKIGVELKIDLHDTVDFNRMRYPLPQPGYHGCVLSGREPANPASFLEVNCGTGGYMNWGAYSNPALDEIIAKLRVELDPIELDRLTKEGGLIAAHDVVTIPLHLDPGKIYWWPWVKNYYGELSLQDDVFGFVPVIAWMWIDQDLKAEMGY